MAVEIKGYIVPDDDQQIYSLFGYTTTAPRDIRKAVQDADGKPLDVEISTCFGGDIFSGSEMYSALRGYAGGVQIHVTGLAASAASVIAMAGPSDMSPTAQLMVHRVSTMAQGNFHAMDDASDSLQQADKAMAAAYVAKAGMTEKDALKMMDTETWITAAQAVELGLIDRISEAATPQLSNAIDGLPLPRAVIEKTRAMLAEKKNPPENPEPPEDRSKAIALANAKLNLIARNYEMR
ncbi:ATP-dependent Clp protease proteolytic subunit [Caprobacter fermentans]|uniref:ATP-dependent Clp protease proteolytic subunit n=1 Tax=Caproicibacter fermentans TaxID=2576756 RepID=A0A6N8I407_9FIRM|nr:head maturation protease, ClpP-related [Caproicibacter fermentans]MVB12340.1 ATP-dependent Clp protease proteolytic subunit [Caproicibacter fermentans]